MPAYELALWIIGAFGAIALSYIFSRILRKKGYSGEGVLLMINVSRTNERGPLAAEQMFASIHGILRETNYFSEAKSNQEHISFEIASVDQRIRFYVWVPVELRSFIESQIYAQYPDVEIYEAPEDYSHDIPTGALVAGTELHLTAHEVLPIKEFEEMEEKIRKEQLDSLSAITEAIGKLNDPNEQVWVQILCKPINDHWWQKRSVLTVNAYQEGKKPLKFHKHYNFIVVNPFLKIALFPLKILLLPLHLAHLLTSSGEEGESSKPAVDSEVAALTEGITEKSKRLGYRVQIRLMYMSKQKVPFQAAAMRLRGVAAAFKQFNTVHLNGFRMKPIAKGDSTEILHEYQRRVFSEKGMLLNAKELASVMHLPNILVHTPSIVWVTSKKLEPPNDVPTYDNTPINELTVIGETNFRGVSKVFGVRDADRRRHVYIIGKTGMGKSTLLENMVKSDIEAGKGVGVIDPHGDLAEAVMRFIPKSRINDVVVFDPSDYEFPVALNLIESVRPEDRSKIASGFVGIFKKMFGNSWGPRLEHILRNTIMALLEYPNSSILGVMRILVDKDYREKVVSKITDPVVKSFWVDEFANINPKNLAEVISPIQNKVGQFLSSPAVRNIIGQSKSTINVREAMDTKKIVVVNLSKGKLGEDMSKLLGSMLVTKFQIDAMSRADIPENQRVDFNLYIDEFQNFATESFESILSEARKYHLNLTIANQYIAQLVTQESDGVKNAVFGNVGTIITFATGADDAEYLAKQFGFEEEEEPYIVGLDKYTIYLRLLIDNIPSTTFTARTLPSPQMPDPAEAEAQRELIIKLSREKYAKPRAEIEETIAKWSENERGGSASVGSRKSPVAPAAPRPQSVPQIDINTLTVGELIEGTITGITNFGIFIDYRGIQGLIHSSEVPDKKMLKPKADLLHKDDTIKAVVLGSKDNKIVLTILTDHAKPVTSDPTVIETITQQEQSLRSRFDLLPQ